MQCSTGLPLSLSSCAVNSLYPTWCATQSLSLQLLSVFVQVAALPHLVAASPSGLLVGSSAIVSNTARALISQLKQGLFLQAQEGLVARCG